MDFTKQEKDMMISIINQEMWKIGEHMTASIEHLIEVKTKKQKYSPTEKEVEHAVTYGLTPYELEHFIHLMNVKNKLLDD